MDSYMASNGSCLKVTWIIFYKPLLGGSPNTKLGTPNDTLNAHNRWFILVYHMWGPTWIEIAFGWGLGHIWLHTTLEGLWPYYMILEVCWDGLWTLSFGLSQFHGHGSWLVCEVALNESNIMGHKFISFLWNTTLHLISWGGVWQLLRMS